MHGQETGMVWRTVTFWNDGNVFKLVGVRNKLWLKETGKTARSSRSASPGWGGGMLIFSGSCVEELELRNTHCHKWSAPAPDS